MRYAALVPAFIIVACVSKTPQRTLQIEVASGAPADVVAAPTTQSSCPAGMIDIEGTYCPNIEEVCLTWVDTDGLAIPEAIPQPGQSGRCGEWKKPSRCLTPEAQRPHKHFCIDKFEYPNVEGQPPQSWMTWYDVKNACEAQGKRMCTRSEFTFACEGPNMQPYPYGDGYHRDRTSCNTDNHVPKGVDVFKATSHESPTSQILDSMLVPAGSKTECVSPFGVHDMVGNIDEFVINETGHPYVSGLMSGHIFGVRNACRPMTDAHGPTFSWYETGGRCCSDAH